MKKILVIDRCKDCPFVYKTIDNYFRCAKENPMGKFIEGSELYIPSWCPLETFQQDDMLKKEKELKEARLDNLRWAIAKDYFPQFIKILGKEIDEPKTLDHWKQVAFKINDEEINAWVKKLMDKTLSEGAKRELKSLGIDYKEILNMDKEKKDAEYYRKLLEKEKLDKSLVEILSMKIMIGGKIFELKWEEAKQLYNSLHQNFLFFQGAHGSGGAKQDNIKS
jgi:hypothetical protein